MGNIFKQICGLLTAGEIKEAGFLSVLIIVMAFLELSGIALIAPFMSLVMKPDISLQPTILQSVYAVAGLKDIYSFIVMYGVGLVGVLWASNLFKSYTMYKLYDFTYSKEYSLSTRLFRTYLFQPYEFFLSRNSSDLSKNILSEVSVLVVGIMVTGMQVLAKLCIIISVVVFLAFVNPFLVLVVGGLFSTVYVAIYFVFHKKLQEMGERRHKLVESRYNDVKEAVMAIKETKIYGYENYFLNSYAGHSSLISRFSAYRDTIAQLPAYLIEAVGFTLLIGIILYVVSKGELSMTDIIPALSMYAFAGYKLLPNIQQAFSGIARIKFTLPTLRHLAREFMMSVPEEKEASVASSQKDVRDKGTLVFSGVTFRYATSETDALSDVNLSIVPSSVVGVVGKTGAGKTTLIDLLLGLLQPTQGKIWLDGGETQPDSSNFLSWKSRFSYVSQNVCLFNDTILQNIAMVQDGETANLEKVKEIIEIVDLTEFVRSISGGLGYVIGENGNRLSGGQRQRLSIARALYRDANILVLDEATSALDKQTEKKILSGIRKVGKTVIMITHRLEHLQFCDSLVYLTGDSKLMTGSYDDVYKNNPEFRRMVESVSV